MFGAWSAAQFFARRRSRLNRQQAALEQQRERLLAQKVNLYQSFRGGALSREGFLREKEGLSNREEAVGRRMEEVQRQMAELAAEGRRQWRIWELLESRGGAGERLENVLRELVEKVIVYGDKRIEVVWRYRDGFGEQER